MENLSSRSEVFCLFIAYFISYGLMLLNYDGIYWDDWVLFGNLYDYTAISFRQAGALLTGDFHILFLSSLNGIFPYRLLCFLAYFVVGVLFYHLLCTVGLFRKSETFTISLLALVIPLNYSRIAMMNVSTSIYLLLFFCAFCLLILSVKRQNLVYRFIANILFFVSFEVNSLLVYYVVPFIYLLYFDRLRWYMNQPQDSIILLVKWLSRKIDLILLPFIYFVIKNLYFKPTGLYDGYNQLPSLKGVGYAFLKAINNLLLTITSISYHLSTYMVVAGFLISICLLLISKNKQLEIPPLNFIRATGLFVLGFMMFILAVFPYTLVGKTPNAIDWESRHQLLIPFGISIMIYVSINYLFGKINKKLPFYAITFLLSIFVLSGINMQLKYQVDFAKQEGIINDLKKIKELDSVYGSALLFEDNYKKIDANERTYRFYEYSGMLRKATGHGGILGVGENRYQGSEYYNQFKKSHYNINEYAGGEIVGIISINKGEITPNLFDGVKLPFFKLFSPNRYTEYIDGLITTKLTLY